MVAGHSVRRRPPGSRYFEPSRLFRGFNSCFRGYESGMPLRTKDFDYHLPEELIASRPLEDRAASRMLVVDRATGRIAHRMFRDLTEYLRPDDLLVLNDTKVIPARVFSDAGDIELLCLDRISPLEWRCLVRPGKRMKPGRMVTVGGISGRVLEVFENGDRLVRWDDVVDLGRHGHLALPHYMGREDEVSDRERYQTVFAREEGAIAAPTAGLHFTPELLETLAHAFLTLHVGVGTFRPVSAEVVSDHIMHSERYAVSAATARKVNAAGRVIAVGTTVTRVLESIASDSEGRRIAERDQAGETNIFIHPPYDFRVIGGLLTNFHLPQSTLIMLVSALAGRELVLEAYRQAVEMRYRFYSYGDCMLLL
jgi:S-adenosylmethionine:tRNA ribosyltransferase-isomerase